MTSEVAKKPRLPFLSFLWKCVSAVRRSASAYQRFLEASVLTVCANFRHLHVLFFVKRKNKKANILPHLTSESLRRLSAYSQTPREVTRYRRDSFHVAHLVLDQQGESLAADELHIHIH